LILDVPDFGFRGQEKPNHPRKEKLRCLSGTYAGAIKGQHHQRRVSKSQGRKDIEIFEDPTLTS
jgi:hypothetical protein